MARTASAVDHRGAVGSSRAHFGRHQQPVLQDEEGLDPSGALAPQLDVRIGTTSISLAHHHCLFGDGLGAHFVIVLRCDSHCIELDALEHALHLVHQVWPRWRCDVHDRTKYGCDIGRVGARLRTSKQHDEIRAVARCCARRSGSRRAERAR